MTDNLLTATEAAAILDMSPGGAHHALGDHHDKIKLPSGHVVRVWRESYVRKVKADRDEKGKKVRERQESRHLKNGMPFDPGEYNPGKSFDFCVDEKGLMRENKKQYRGRVCRHEGCPTPVPTGKIYCDEHSHIFKAMRKNVATHGEAFNLSGFRRK